MRYINGYFSAWVYLAKISSPLWLCSGFFLGIDCFITLYLFYLISAASVGGIVKLEINKNSA